MGKQLPMRVGLTDILEHRVIGTSRARQRSSLWQA